MLPVRIQDSRDQRFELFEPARKSYLLSYDREKTGAGVVREVASTKKRASVGRIVQLSLMGLLLGYFLLIGVISAIVGNYGPSIFIFVILVLSFLELFVRRWYRRWRHREVVLRALIAQDKCGSCGYKMLGLTPADDGCVVCPECGAAWRTDKRRHDEHPRWDRPFPWLTKFVYDDRGWCGRPRFGIRASAIGSNAKRRRLLLKASGRLGIASYVIGWCLIPILIGSTTLAILLENIWVVLWGLGVTILGAIVRALLWAIARSVSAEQMRTALLERGHCACCDERLPEEPAFDGLYACAACGAAWRVEKSG